MLAQQSLAAPPQPHNFSTVEAAAPIQDFLAKRPPDSCMGQAATWTEIVDMLPLNLVGGGRRLGNRVLYGDGIAVTGSLRDHEPGAKISTQILEAAHCSCPRAKLPQF